MNSRSDCLSSDLSVDGDRLWVSIMHLAQIGATPKGGVCRLALTDLDKMGRDQVVSWAKEAGLTVVVDQIGNIFMRRPGRDNRLPAVMMGSHIDTQPTGGKFDGNYGVLAALEVVRTLNDHQIVTTAPLEVVSWTNEEGSRFVPVMMGSGVFAREISLEHAYAAKDATGKTVHDELARIGYLGTAVPGSRPAQAYFEVHIEQGPVLEDHDKVIGVVEAVLGVRWYDCVVTGMEAHAGPTPMSLRKDALQVATRLMQQVVTIANGYQPHGRGTVGSVQVYPNSRNVIPGEVKFSVDLRNISIELLDRMDTDFRAVVDSASRESRLAISLAEVSHYAPIPFHPECIGLVRDASSRLGYPTMPVVSGAGHDAIYMARVAPTGMIFIPCKDGISHNEIESAQPDHVTAGCNVLLHAVTQRAGLA